MSLWRCGMLSYDTYLLSRFLHFSIPICVEWKHSWTIVVKNSFWCIDVQGLKSMCLICFTQIGRSDKRRDLRLKKPISAYVFSTHPSSFRIITAASRAHWMLESYSTAEKKQLARTVTSGIAQSSRGLYLRWCVSLLDFLSLWSLFIWDNATPCPEGICEDEGSMKCTFHPFLTAWLCQAVLTCIV
jgi:hypothetical protein